jgi:N-formylglutamate deformylase
VCRVSDSAILHGGDAPLLVSFPHDGTLVPAEIAARMTPAARTLPDTDWHVARLYAFVRELGASTLRPLLSRYVVDLNRDPTGDELYPGADNTGIVPTTTFDSEPIYLPGEEPAAGEVTARIERWFRPYHSALAAEVARLHADHGVVVVLDAHSIRSQVPRFFQGILPDLSFGTAGGKSAGVALAARAYAALEQAGGYSAVRDARFKGGYITRHYGQPQRGVHAVQLELAQKNYMTEAPPYTFDEERAAGLQPVLERFVTALLDAARQGAR